MRFNFVGKIELNPMDAKIPFYKVIKTEKANGHTLNATCVAASNNRAFVETPGFIYKTVTIYDGNGGKEEVDWEDRPDPDMVKTGNVPNVVSFLDGTRKSFITDYDFVEFVKDRADYIKGKRFMITGSTKKNEYAGKITDRFQMKSLFEIAEDDERKNQLKVTGDFYFNKDSLDTVDFAKERKIYLNGWTKESWDKNHKDLYIAKQIVIDCNKIDFNDENHIARLNYQLKQIGCALDEDGKVVTKLKKKNYYCISVILSYENGAESIEFSEADLTDNQKLAISLGVNKLEDFKPSGQIYGERRVVWKFKGWDLRKDYADGCVIVDDEDFEDKIYAPMPNETFKDLEKAMNPPVSDDDDEDLDDLFS